MKKLIFFPIIRMSLDLALSPLVLLGALYFRYIRARKMDDMPVSRKVFKIVGILPISDHYYEPLINPGKYLKKPLSENRVLPGLDMNKEAQKALLAQFDYNAELLALPLDKSQGLSFFYKNGSYPAGDAEILYSMVRCFRPSRIIEVGAGMSTLLIQEALKENTREGKLGEHICIEPFEMDWLEQLSITIIREKVEQVGVDFFRQLNKNDVLFIDSSHIIRPQGDVLFEYLELLPSLNSGVLIHIHDVFTPKDYPADWIYDHNRLWNEQYLLEAFLSNNKDFTILLATNFMRHEFPNLFFSKAPVLSTMPIKEPGSIWIQKI